MPHSYESGKTRHGEMSVGVANVVYFFLCLRKGSISMTFLHKLGTVFDFVRIQVIPEACPNSINSKTVCEQNSKDSFRVQVGE